jgi:hypothetical protein
VVRVEALVVLAVLVVLVVAGTSAWVFFDAPWRGLSRRWAAACVVVWPVAFPWYLAVRRGGPPPSLNPPPPDPYPVKLPPGYRPPAPMVPPPPEADRGPAERDERGPP